MAELADRFLLSMRRKGEERRVVVILSENCGGCGKTSEKKPQTTSEYCFATSPSLSPGQRAILFIYFHSWWWWSWLVIDSPEMWRIVSHLSPPHKVKLYQYPAPIGHLTVWQIWHHVTNNGTDQNKYWWFMWLTARISSSISVYWYLYCNILYQIILFRARRDTSSAVVRRLLDYQLVYSNALMDMWYVIMWYIDLVG